MTENADAVKENADAVTAEAPSAPKPKGKRTARKKRTSPKIWKLYDISENGVNKLRKDCPRCGSGVFLAEHSNRLACGGCGYAEFTKK